MDSLPHYINGAWRKSSADTMDVDNPATLELIASVPLATNAEVDEAVKSSIAAAFPDWRNTPTNTRIQYLFKLKALLEDHVDEIAELITVECGKTLAESRGELTASD